MSSSPLTQATTCLKLLAITNHYPPHHGGGYGLQMGWFCDRLATRGHSLQVLTSAPQGTTVSHETSPFPVSRHLSLIDNDLSPRELFRFTLHNRGAVRRAIRDTAPDMIFCGGFDGVGFNTYLAAIESGLPSFTWLGDTWLAQAWRDLRRYDQWSRIAGGGQGLGLKRLVKRMVGSYGRHRGLYDGPRPRSFAPVGALSQFVLDDLYQSGAPVSPEAQVISVCLHRAFEKTSTEVIGHSGSRVPHLRALFVGRMERLKGPDAAIKALAVAVAQGADVRLTFAGLLLEQSRPELMAEAKSLGVADRITWAGTPSQPELVHLYRNHDVFLFPSRIVEGLGIVNCEAIACGLPVIGTADSGAAEVIVPGVTGFRVAIDDTNAMGTHLAQLHTDRGLLDKLSASATGYAHRFLADAIIDRLEREIVRLHGTFTAQNTVRKSAAV
jgi:glycosyltransferase involved in cell wall biosynthesis